MNTDYDVIVIGAGPAGENAADRAQRSGLKAAIIERDLVGGECSYWACMPSKALLRPGEALRAIGRVPGAREAVTGNIDVAAALERRDALAAHWDDAGQVKWLDGVGVDLIRGHGRLVGERTVEVESEDEQRRVYQAAKAVVLATGTGAAMPSIAGLAEAAPWDNRDIAVAKQVPRRLVVLGGGVVGVEMAQAWRSLGAEEVTIVELMPRLLPREEPFAGEELRASLEGMGITVITGCQMVKVSRESKDGPVTAYLEDVTRGGRAVTTDQELEADEILVAVGRRPLTSDIGLETIGLRPNHYISVDDRMIARDVPGEWLYAVGDVNGRSLLTHTGKYQARIAGDHIAGKDVRAWGDEKAVPRVVFTDPQVAAVGLTEEEAQEQGIRVRSVDYGTGRTAGAATVGRGIKGTSRLVIDEDRRVIVGATFVGPGVGEMLHAATIAIIGEITLDALWHAIPSFPTMSEIWLRFLEEYGM